MRKISLAILFLLSLANLKGSCQGIGNLSSMLQSFEKDLDFAGVVLVAKGNEVLLHEGYGYLDKQKTIKTEKDAIYNIASITKSFTAIAIMKLAEQGKLGLTDTMAKFFPDLPSDKSGISIHQLLIHQSGIPQTYAAEGEMDADKAAGKIGKVKTDVRPGEKFIYSNGNYTLLGIVIEKVTGKKWKDYIRETILSPLQMNHTFFWGEENRTGFPMVVPKEKIKQKKEDYGFQASTGIFSNAADLLKFQNALKGSVILTDSSRALLFGNYIKLKSAFPNSTDYYGYGIFHTTGEWKSIWTRGNEESWGMSVTYLIPEKDISIVVLTSSEQLRNGEKSHIYVSSQIIKQLQ